MYFYETKIKSTYLRLKFPTGHLRAYVKYILHFFVNIFSSAYIAEESH